MNVKCSVDIVYLLHGSYGTFSNAIDFFSDIDIKSLECHYDVNLICLTKGCFDIHDVTRLDSNIKILAIPNIGRDIYSYYYYSCYLSKADFVCYFNTGSKILSAKFLPACLNHLSKNDFDVCAATGSYGAFVSSKYFISLRPLLVSVGERFLNYLKIIYCKFIEYILRIFAIFLIPHIRTNAYVIRRDIFVNSFDEFFFGTAPKSRLFSLLYESSNRGLSGHIIRKGGRLLIVGSNGVVYGVNQWKNSATYCSFCQKNLAVHDNRTKEFELSSSLNKLKLYIGAWKHKC
jgi:hypothetical protein